MGQISVLVVYPHRTKRIFAVPYLRMPSFICRQCRRQRALRLQRLRNLMLSPKTVGVDVGDDCCRKLHDIFSFIVFDESSSISATWQTLHRLCLENLSPKEAKVLNMALSVYHPLKLSAVESESTALYTMVTTV